MTSLSLKYFSRNAESVSVYAKEKKGYIGSIKMLTFSTNENQSMSLLVCESGKACVQWNSKLKLS